MTTYGISMMRNEIDVAVDVVEHMLEECDHVIVLDNASTDGTLQALLRLAHPRLDVLYDRTFAYEQSAMMTRLMDKAREDGADWIVPFDADEWWFVPIGRIADVLAEVPASVIATGTTTYDMVPQPTDEDHRSPFRRMVHHRPGSLWSRPESRKAAVRPIPGAVLLQGNHGLVGHPLPPIGPLSIRHYPYRSLEQAKAKVRHGRAAIQAAGLPLGSGTHWQELGALTDDEFAAWWLQWTDPVGLIRWT